MMQRRRLVAILVVCSLLMPITVFLQIHSTYGRTGRIHSIEYTLDFSQRALHDIEVKMVIKGTLASSDRCL
jgi:hypothetical protein